MTERAMQEICDFSPRVERRNGPGRSRVANLSGQPLYQEVTLRNLNTTRKLLAMLRETPRA